MMLTGLVLKAVLVTKPFAAYNLNCLVNHLLTGKNRTLFLLVLTVYMGMVWTVLMLFLVTVVARSLLLATRFLCPLPGIPRSGSFHMILLFPALSVQYGASLPCFFCE